MMSDNKKSIAIVRARWHAEIVDRCVEAAARELKEKATGDVVIFDVPGALEIPLLSQKLARTGGYSAIIACAFVVDGGIYRHDFVAATVLDAMMKVQLDTEVPIFSAVLTPHNFQETDAHIEFFKTHFVIKGKEVAEACLRTLEVTEGVVSKV